MQETGEQSSSVTCGSVVREQEYETQFFGFAPRAFTDGMYNAVFDYFNDAVSVAENHLIELYSDIMPEDEIKESSKKILAVTVKAADKAFDKLEAYLNTNILHIPSHVILPEDSVHRDAPCTEKDNEAIDQEISALEGQIKELQNQRLMLTQEIEDQNKVKQELKLFLDYMDTLKQTAWEAGVANWQDHLTFGFSKAEELLDTIRRVNKLES